MQSAMFSIIAITFSCIGSHFMWMTSSERVFAELRGANKVVRSGLVSQSYVSSEMQCLHRCRLTKGCSGMNLGMNGDGRITCQLTSLELASGDDGDEFLEELEGWNYYQVVDLTSSSSDLSQIKFEIYINSFAQQDSADAPQPTDSSILLINGAGTSLSKGINVVSLRYDDTSFKSVRRFEDSSSFQKCANFLNSRAQGSIVGIVVVDTAVGSSGEALPDYLTTALRRVGVHQTDIGYRQPFCFINMVETNVTWRQEVLNRNSSEPSICHAEIY